MGCLTNKRDVLHGTLQPTCQRKGNKKALFAVGHSLLKCIHYVLSTGGRYKELGDSYVPEKKEKQRKEYLKGELRKLGYDVALTKKKD